MINILPKALEEIKKVMSETGQKYLRVGVRGGGCHGFQYLLNLNDEYKENTDSLCEQDGIYVVTDKRSELYLNDVSIDFHEGLSQRGFVFTNPGVKATCGCGSAMH